MAGRAEGGARLRGRALQRRNRRLAARDPLCADCREEGRIRPAEEWDHIIPLHKGGADDESNLRGLCREHHLVKTRKDMGYRPRPRIGADGWPIDE